jgi:hypothetical protein
LACSRRAARGRRGGTCLLDLGLRPAIASSASAHTCGLSFSGLVCSHQSHHWPARARRPGAAAAAADLLDLGRPADSILGFRTHTCDLSFSGGVQPQSHHWPALAPRHSAAASHLDLFELARPLQGLLCGLAFGRPLGDPLFGARASAADLFSCRSAGGGVGADLFELGAHLF